MSITNRFKVQSEVATFARAFDQVSFEKKTVSFFYIGCLAVFFGYYIGRFELVSDWIALQEVGEYVRRFGLIFLILRWLFVVGRTSHPGFVALGGIVVAVCYQLSNTTTILCSYLVIVGSIGIGLDELVDHFRRAIGFIIAFCIATYLVILLVSPEMVSLYYRNQDFSNPRHGFLLGHPNFISALLVYYFVLCLLSRSASRSYKVMVFAVSALIIGLFTDSRTSLGLLFIVGLGYIVNNRFDFFTNRKICFIVAVLPMILMLFTYLLATMPHDDNIYRFFNSLLSSRPHLWGVWDTWQGVVLFGAESLSGSYTGADYFVQSPTLDSAYAEFLYHSGLASFVVFELAVFGSVKKSFEMKNGLYVLGILSVILIGFTEMDSVNICCCLAMLLLRLSIEESTGLKDGA